VKTAEVLELLQRVAEEVVNPRFRALDDEQIDEKNPGDLVTVADREAEELLTDALTRAHPDALVLGEEATATDDTLLPRFRAADHAFTIDPVDGTKNFVHGSRDHAVMAAELRDGEVVRSWIWQPQHATAYVAERGQGAWRNGERLLRPPIGERPRGVTSRRRWIGQTLDGLPPLELTWVCCGVDYPKLVEGEADYLVYRGTQPWDHSPGSLILEESGAFVGTFAGGRYRPQQDPPTGIIATADEELYQRVLAHLGELS
jgi:fructose-1,6-bisphosphatase/inositol monophosphatase family enzyme